MDRIDGLALQELREYYEALLDDPEYVSDCPQGAARGRLIIALMDERDARIDATAAPQPAPEPEGLREALQVYADDNSWAPGWANAEDCRAWAWAGPGAEYVDERGAPWRIAREALARALLGEGGEG